MAEEKQYTIIDVYDEVYRRTGISTTARFHQKDHKLLTKSEFEKEVTKQANFLTSQAG